MKKREIRIWLAAAAMALGMGLSGCSADSVDTGAQSGQESEQKAEQEAEQKSEQKSEQKTKQKAEQEVEQENLSLIHIFTTAILGSGICNTEQTAMMTDVGTNGEIVLFSKGRLVCCATAAGPAFEGAGLSCGMRGVNGAIDHVKWEDGAWKVHVIGSKEAQGICGSGVIDGVAALLERDVYKRQSETRSGR